MVWHHVPQRPRFLVVAAAMLDPDALGCRDLHVIDVAAIPHRLKDAICKPEDQDVLDGLFAEVVIDPVNLAFIQHLPEFVIERSGGSQVVTERLLNDDAAPGAAGLERETLHAELPNDLAEETRCGGQIEQVIAAGPSGLVHLREQVLEMLVGMRVPKITRDVIQTLGEPVPQSGINRACCVLVDLAA